MGLAPGQAPTSELLALSSEQWTLVDVLSEHILPETDTPGARAARVADFVDHMLERWFGDQAKAAFVAGLTTLDERSVERYGVGFVGATPPQQIELMKEAEADAAANRSGFSSNPSRLAEAQFFDVAKWLTLFGYYTSEVGHARRARIPRVAGSVGSVRHHRRRDLGVGGPRGPEVTPAVRLDRRQWLVGVLGALATLGRPRRAQAAAVERVGLQLYTLRAEMAEDPIGTLRRVGAMGFDEVEFAGYHSLSVSEVKSALEDAGLSAPAAHVGLRPLVDDTQRLIDECVAVGHRYLVLAYLQPAERQRLDQYRRYVDDLQTVGEACRDAGIQLAYHNHDFEFERLEGEVPYDLLLDGTDPELVKMELDLYWITRAGADPLTYFARHPGRFPLFHVKDLDGETGGFVEVGRGIVDFAGAFRRGEQAGVRHYFIEQDVIRGDRWASLEASLAYLRRLRY